MVSTRTRNKQSSVQVSVASTMTRGSRWKSIHLDKGKSVKGGQGRFNASLPAILNFTIMTKTDVTTQRVIKDGKLAMKLTWWKNGILDHVEYVTDKELVY